MEFKLPGFKNKKDVTDSSVSFEEKNIALQERMNRIYKFGGIGGMLIGGLSLLALNAALPLKTTVVDAYLIDKVTGVAERLTSVKKENLSENEAIARYFITQYIKHREGYNFFSLQHDYDYVMAYSAENVAADYNDIGAYIRFRLTIRDVATGQTRQEFWNVRLTYRIEPQVEMVSGERNNNPLKFVVTSYVRDKEARG